VRIGALVAALIGVTVAGPVLAQQPQQTPQSVQGAGYVSNLSGPLFAVKSDGTRRVLSTQSVVNPGDTLVTEDKTYARVRFTDTSEVTLRPSTQFQIENYAFDRAAPEKDSSLFRLFKGALRTVTGLIGKRGSVDAYKLSTATATIGIRGTIFGVTVCLPGTCGSLAAGTYVNVIEGSVAIAPPPPVVAVIPVPGAPTPPAAAPPGAPPAGPPGAPAPPAGPPVAAPGAPPPAAAPVVPVTPPAAPVLLSAGQFGYVPPAGPPVQLPSDPGIGRLFAPPPSFTSRQEAPPPAQQQPGTPAAKPVSRPSSGECEVR
jgi:hypothetical protein